MIWDLEERVEDAIAAYLRTAVGGDIRVYEAWNYTARQYPCVIVAAPDTMPISETANFAPVREVRVELAIMVEAAPEIVDGAEMKTTRERNATARGTVVSALARGDLCEAVTATQPARVLFSMIQLGTTSRSVDDAGRLLITTVSLDTIASPAEAA